MCFSGVLHKVQGEEQKRGNSLWVDKVGEATLKR